MIPDSRARLWQSALTRLAERDAAGLRRRIGAPALRRGAWIEHQGRSLISFASNDYLGLAQDPRLTQALVAAAGESGCGSAAAHLLGGHLPAHAELEEALCDWLQAESALLFSAGYLANLGLLAGLLGRKDSCIQDRLNHASLIDGALLSGARLRRYRHADVDSAEQQLIAAGDSPSLLVSDGVFSMDGDLAPLAGLVDIAQKHRALLALDEAHAVGVIGPGGRGTAAHFGLDAGSVPLRVVTFGKALGGAGAAILGPRDLIAALTQFARPFIYTTAMPPALAAAVRRAVAIARDADQERARLHAHIQRLRAGLANCGAHLVASETPIQPLLVGDAAAATALSQALWRRGFQVPAVRPPTVPAGAARLRITVSAAHDEAQIDGLIEAIGAEIHAIAR